MKRLTLEEIGRRAGVSRSTVSRVVNGHRDVSADVKERVLAVVADTGYRPNSAARSLASSRTGVLGLVIPSNVHSLFDDPYFGRLIQGITKASNAADQTLALFLFEDEREETEMYPRVISNSLLDGLILTATRMGDPIVERLRVDGVPFVMVGRPDSDSIPYVDATNQRGAFDATMHLIEHGRRRLGSVAAPSNTTAGVDRRSGFMAALASAGIPLEEGLVVEGDFSERSGLEAMTRVLEAEPDAVFCASDTMAVGALKAIVRAGLRCPEDVALVGFDGLADANQTNPSLTTMYQPVVETGEAAVALLLDVVDLGSVAEPRKVLPTELIVRRSCGCSEEGLS